ncbi:FAD-binding oxidoreductase [Streptomyces sp. NBC_01497]|uniref:FAD-binding oxidoreductase n=1 Tax=Streptomyces sp. NBC_01497 TaxID=2903885 RepID=UPI002E2FA9B6|nr:FAD-binding oxidoreductase [Streptomyces sp. NBC_01497]
MVSPASDEGPPPGLFADDVAALAAGVTGEVFQPGDAGYGVECATFNLALTHRPAVAVGAAEPADVQAAVRFATADGLAVAVLATGHQAIVPADGAVLINTRRMSAVTADPSSRRALVQAGARVQQVIDGAAEFDLSPMVGSSPSVGVVGFTLGGGLSPTFGRAFGWGADYVHAIEVVTADGRLRRVSAREEPDLFWALRGSRSNMGVVTAVEMELHDVTRLYGGGLFFSGRDAASVLDAYRGFTASVPDQLTSSIALLRMPDVASVPELLRDAFMVHIRIAYVGTAAEGDRLAMPLRRAVPPVLDTLGDMPLTDFASIHNDPVDPLFFREWTAMLREFTPEAVDTLIDIAGPGTDPPVEFDEVRHLGGAFGRQVGPPSAVGNRDAAFAVWIMSTGPSSVGDATRVRGGCVGRTSAVEHRTGLPQLHLVRYDARERHVHARDLCAAAGGQGVLRPGERVSSQPERSAAPREMTNSPRKSAACARVDSRGQAVTRSSPTRADRRTRRLAGTVAGTGAPRRGRPNLCTRASCVRSRRRLK